MTTKEILTLVIATLGTAIALATLVKACLEYVRQGRLSRTQVFFDLRRRLKEPHLAKLAEWIDEEGSSDPVRSQEAHSRLARAPFRDKRDYLGVFEEVEMAMGSGLLKPRIALYMFGYYATRCANSEGFWNGVGQWNPYWDRFFDFCRKMEIEEHAFERDRMRSISGSQKASRSITDARPVVDETANDGPRVTIQMPPVLRPSVEGLKEVEVRGHTVGEALERLVEQNPRLRVQIFQLAPEDGKRDELNRFINVYYDHEDVRVMDGLDTAVAAGGTIVLLPGVCGG